MCACVIGQSAIGIHPPNECVNFRHVDVVQFLYGLFYLRFVGSQVHDEHQSIVILNLLHCTLCREWVFYDVVLVEPGATGDALARVLGPPHALEGLGSVEVNGSADLRLEFSVYTSQDGLFGFQRLRLGLGGLGGRGWLAWGREKGVRTL